MEGKTVKGSLEDGSKYPIHILIAFCTKNGMSLTQELVDVKENEIVAIPKLLKLIIIQNGILTINDIVC